MKRIVPLLAVAVGLGVAQAAHAQMGPQDTNGAVASSKALFEVVKGYLVASAEQMPEEKYGYKPTPEVRSFGQIIGHVANSQYGFCSTALGEKPPVTEDMEKRTTKASLVQGLKDAFAYCEKAYAMSDAAAAATTKLFGADRSRLFVLVFNVSHDFEHYGNLVTYMRLNGMVPPSSQPRSGQGG
ncbi:MAG: DinB family protein [Gemmatimonadota bacterium]|jgi:uncharacterized damage-inducible protein DinB